MPRFNQHRINLGLAVRILASYSENKLRAFYILQLRSDYVIGELIQVAGSGVARNFRQGVRQSVAFCSDSITDKNIGTSARFYA